MLITEQEAIKAKNLADQFPDRADVIKASATVLKAYKQQQEAAWQPLFPEMRRQEAEDFAKVRTYFTNPETHGLDEETRRAIFSDLPDEESRAAMFSEELLARSFRRPTKEIRALGTQYRDQYAIAKWGEPVKTYKEFFDKAAREFKLEDEASDLGIDAALAEIGRASCRERV